MVEIKHDNNLITTYQGLSNVTVKKNQTVNQGDIIGKSGKIKITIKREGIGSSHCGTMGEESD